MRSLREEGDRTIRRSLTLCADDFGLATGIDDAILDLIERRRLSAVSCLVVGRSWLRSAPFLCRYAGEVEIGLHFTLTHLAPAGPMPRLAPRGTLPPLAPLIRAAVMKRLDGDEIRAELDRQLDLFFAAIGRPPAFLDGHQHVHQLPGVREVVIAACRDRLAGAWLRYPAMPPQDVLVHRTAIARTLTIGALGRGFRALGGAHGIAGNGTFRGVRSGRGEPPFAVLFRRFLRRLGERPLMMCHPGAEGDPFVSDREAATLARRDEYRFLASADFPRVLNDFRLSLGGLRGPAAGGVDTAARC